MACQHGREGYCHDEATPAEREAMTVLHRHAYNWALPYGRDEAEQYATRYAANYYQFLDDAPAHNHDRFIELTR